MEANVSYKLSSKPVYQFRHRTFDHNNEKKMRRRIRRREKEEGEGEEGGGEEEEGEGEQSNKLSSLLETFVYTLRTTQSKHLLPSSGRVCSSQVRGLFQTLSRKETQICRASG